MCSFEDWISFIRESNLPYNLIYEKWDNFKDSDDCLLSDDDIESIDYELVDCMRKGYDGDYCRFVEDVIFSLEPQNEFEERELLGLKDVIIDEGNVEEVAVRLVNGFGVEVLE